MRLRKDHHMYIFPFHFSLSRKIDFEKFSRLCNDCHSSMIEIISKTIDANVILIAFYN